MENARKIFDALVNNDESAAQKHFNAAISDKLQMSMDVKRVAVTAGIFNKSVDEAVKLDTDLALPKSYKDIVDMLKNAKQIKIGEDEYIKWYSSLDKKMSNELQKVVRSDKDYKRAYDSGYNGDSEKNPFKKGTLSAAVWSNEYSTGAYDA